MEKVRQRVIKVLTGVLDIPAEKVDRVNSFADLENWDSLHHLHVVLGIEKEFGIHFDLDDVTLIYSISSAVDLINRKC
jgi:acyl carrier protein